MRYVLWIGFATLASLWSLIALCAGLLIGWSVDALAGGTLGELAMRSAQSPISLWLAPWIGPEMSSQLQLLALDLAQGLRDLLPRVGGLEQWITPVLWIGWALGMAVLVVATMLLHWAFRDVSVIGRRRGH